MNSKYKGAEIEALLDKVGSAGMNYVEVPISSPTIALAAVNTCYWFNGMVVDGTPITISAFELPNTPEARYRFCFFGPSSLTLPSDVSWLNGEIPELDPSCSYELDVVATQIVTGGYVYKAVLAKFSTPS